MISRSRVRCVSLNSAMPADAQRRVQQSAVAVHADVAGRRARQPGEVVDAVLAGRRRAVRMTHRRVEQLRHRGLDDVAGAAPHPCARRPFRIVEIAPACCRGGGMSGLAFMRSSGRCRRARRARPRRSQRTGSPASVEDTAWRTPGTSMR